MGIKDFLEEAAGALAAEKGLEALDPNANLLEKGLAAVAGFEGVKLVKEHFAAEGAEQPVDQSVEQGGWDDAPAADTAE
jgi:hypothetical protein